jgi:hypothetical protein
MITKIFQMIITGALKLGFGGIVDKVLDHWQAQANNETERERIRSRATIEVIRAQVQAYREEQETHRKEVEEGTARQRAKMNYPVFWAIIVISLGPGVLNLWLIWLYNWLWWENGIWPQAWSIAQYPPQSAIWIDMSIRWLYDPVGFGTSLIGATIAGRATRRQ